MKIAFILPSLANKGPIVFTKYLIEGLKEKVDYIEVFYFRDIVELDLGVPTKQISFFEKIDFDGFDVIHTTMAKPDLYARFNIKKLKSKWILSMHNYFIEDLKLLYPYFKYKLLSKIWKIAFDSCTNIIVSSNQMKTYYEGILGIKNFIVIPYGISNKVSLKDIDSKEEKYLKSIKNKYLVIGSVGLLIHRKGFHQLIDFLKNNQKCAVILIGDGEKKEELKQIAKDNQLSERFVLLGFKPNSIDYYKYFDIYAMTSYSEGFGLAMIEAMSHSLPIVCSKLEIYKDYFTNDDVGFFDLDNKKSLEDAIIKVSNNLDFYKLKSYNLFKNKFSLEVMANNHINFYKKVINKDNY